MGYEEQIKAVEEEIKNTPYNKASQLHISFLKVRIAKLKEKQEKEIIASRKAGIGYNVKKEGHATIALVGFPSVGKSTLINALTNAGSLVAAYDFTTQNAIPGIMQYNGAKIQIIDIPGIIDEASKGKGEGRKVISVARMADLILIILDAKGTDKLGIIKKELYNSNLRLNQKPPDIGFKKSTKGGLKVSSTVKLTKINIQTAKELLREKGIVNADIIIRDDVTANQLVDFIMGNRVYTKGLVVVNKADMLSEQEKQKLKNFILISAEKKEGLEFLKQKIWENLGLMRVFTKASAKKKVGDEPVIMKLNSTVGDLCNRVHKEFSKKFRFARIWGKSALFPGQKVGKEHILKEGDIVRIFLD